MSALDKFLALSPATQARDPHTKRWIPSGGTGSGRSGLPGVSEVAKRAIDRHGASHGKTLSVHGDHVHGDGERRLGDVHISTTVVYHKGSGAFLGYAATRTNIATGSVSHSAGAGRDRYAKPFKSHGDALAYVKSRG